jgi:hypothetical protein
MERGGHARILRIGRSVNSSPGRRFVQRMHRGAARPPQRRKTYSCSHGRGSIAPAGTTAIISSKRSRRCSLRSCRGRRTSRSTESRSRNSSNFPKIASPSGWCPSMPCTSCGASGCRHTSTGQRNWPRPTVASLTFPTTYSPATAGQHPAGQRRAGCCTAGAWGGPAQPAQKE